MTQVHGYNTYKEIREVEKKLRDININLLEGRKTFQDMIRIWYYFKVGMGIEFAVIT